MALSDFTGPDYIDAWTRDLDSRWPERAEMADCVVRTLVEWRNEWRGGGAGSCGLNGGRVQEKIRLLELGVGAGGLASAVMDALTNAHSADAQSGDAHYGPGTGITVDFTGIDIEPALVRHVEVRLESAGHRGARVLQADLRDGCWMRGIEPVDAVYSLQIFHDLGGIEALKIIYRQIHGILAPSGILVNADFVVPFEKDDPERPRRLPVETHRDLLTGLRFVDFSCEMRLGKIACMAARRP